MVCASVPDKTFPFEDNCEKNDEGNLSSSSSSGCSILLCCDDSSQTVISTQGVVLGVSHDTLLHVRNEDGSSEVLKQVVSNSDSGLWEICNADRHSSQSAGGRYFNSSDNQLCSECGGRRWRMHKCRVCCIFCGEEGHEKVNVIKSIVMLVWHLRCGQQGHNSTLCTELWRQYRNTTKEGKPVRLYCGVKSKGCCNCGRRGHTVEDCRCKPLKSHFLGPLPKRRVLVYDKTDIYKPIRSNLAKMREKSRKLRKEKTDISKSTSEKNSNQTQKRIRPQKENKLKRKTSKYNTVCTSFNKLYKSVNEKLFQKVMEQELPYATSSSPFIGGDCNRKSVMRNSNNPHIQSSSSPGASKMKTKKKEKRRVKIQSPSSYGNNIHAPTSSYHLDADRSDFSITQRTRKRRKTRSTEDVYKVSNSYASIFHNYQNPLGKAKKKKFSQSLIS
ncbi:unnamed protein product [Heterobilharzia americana]|nr:unnamed protein product [Heterobilharzia americana]